MTVVGSSGLGVWAVAALGAGLACAGLFAIEEAGRRSWLSRCAWPIAALFGAMLWLMFYLGERRLDAGSGAAAKALADGAKAVMVPDPTPMAVIVCIGAPALIFALAAAFWRRHAGGRRGSGTLSFGAANLLAWQLGMYAFLAIGQVAGPAFPLS
jgi:hypothetical protein